MGSAEPAIIPCVPDEVEALSRSGDSDEAETLVDRLGGAGPALDRPWARATAARCRGCCRAARGDLDGARGGLAPSKSTSACGSRSRPPRRARARPDPAPGKQKRSARESLDETPEIFAELGAHAVGDGSLPSWPGSAGAARAARADADRGGVGASSREGRTNREVADALFMSPRTVQAHLKRIYRKLGVRSERSSPPGWTCPPRVDGLCSKRTRMGDSSEGASPYRLGRSNRRKEAPDASRGMTTVGADREGMQAQTLHDPRLLHVRWLQLVVVALLIAIVAVGARAVSSSQRRERPSPRSRSTATTPEAARSQPGASDRVTDAAQPASGGSA